MNNAFTVDLEHWYDIELARNFIKESEKIDQLEAALRPLVKLLNENKTRATFFVLEGLAREHPDLIRRLFDEGHEIASHGSSHKMLCYITKDEFGIELQKSKKIIRSITKKNPVGYRAPTFSINQESSWALSELEMAGFKYDSSIFPVRNFLYGVTGAPLQPYKPDKSDITKSSEKGIVEFPLATVEFFGRRVPIAGGFYLRALPREIVTLGLSKMKKERKPAVIFVHPWEMYRHTPRMKLKLKSRLITYYGCDAMEMKVRHILKRFRFCPIEQLMMELGYL
jgi:polysaccharide deacetylase family protein (PEP-CTERM system associated)